MQKRIGIVSYFSTGAYDANTVDENQFLAEILKELTMTPQVVAWSDPTVDWSEFDALIIKSTWDYFDFYSQFLEWIGRLEQIGVPVFNDVNCLRWNSSKSYLLEMQQKGYPVIPGKLLPKGQKLDLERIKDEVSSNQVVFKPLVSGGAKHTIRYSFGKDEDPTGYLESLLESESFLVQPFIEEVALVGEYSLIFFNGRFSHAVLKTPALSDFRVQHYFGGSITSARIDSGMMQIAQRFVRDFASESLYARVDGVMLQGKFHLMELELIEPYLFLTSDPAALANYRDALALRLG